MVDKYNLTRFVEAQSNSYKTALEEIRNGKKYSHWMWFIFPQYKGLGRSYTSLKYAINSEEEAINYLKHPILGSRLIEITKMFQSIENKTALEILGRPDDLKMKSSMTLFDTIQSETDLFNKVLEKYFKGKRCNQTIRALNPNNATS